ncbi:hypothetical protein [Tenacibaculum sp. 190524A02b]|uniref:Natural product n=1 Tax=Tenacibaculum vairaonense TaxID=3137860 RepID=A0ABP1FEY4_9FLAO
MKKSILKLGEALDKKEQKEISGGGKPSTRHCRYYCNGTTQTLAPGQGPDCYLYLPYLITNSLKCGGAGNEDGGDWA